MPKRKAKDLGASEEPRRSSRRISTKSEDVAPEPSARVPAPKKAKKESKKELKNDSKAAEKTETVANGKEEEGLDDVGFPAVLASSHCRRMNPTTPANHV